MTRSASTSCNTVRARASDHPFALASSCAKFRNTTVQSRLGVTTREVRVPTVGLQVSVSAFVEGFATVPTA